MKDLSMIQKYFICAVNERGKIPKLQMQKQICLVAAGLSELQSEGCISISDKEVKLTGALPERKEYLKPLYGILDTLKSIPVTEDLTTYSKQYDYAFLDEKLNELTEAVGRSLEYAGVVRQGKAGLLGGTRGFVPDRSLVLRTIDDLKQQIDAGTECEQTISLAVLLQRGKCFESHLQKKALVEMEQKIRHLLAKEEYRLLKELTHYLDQAMAAVLQIARL